MNVIRICGVYTVCLLFLFKWWLSERHESCHVKLLLLPKQGEDKVGLQQKIRKMLSFLVFPTIKYLLIFLRSYVGILNWSQPTQNILFWFIGRFWSRLILSCSALVSMVNYLSQQSNRVQLKLLSEDNNSTMKIRPIHPPLLCASSSHTSPEAFQLRHVQHHWMLLNIEQCIVTVLLHPFT